QSNQTPRFLRFQPDSSLRRVAPRSGSCRRPSSYPNSGESEVMVTNSTKWVASQAVEARKSPSYASGAAITSLPPSTANQIPAKGTNVSREVGGLSRADAAPSKPVALGVARVPDGGGRRHRRGGRPHGRLGT